MHVRPHGILTGLAIASILLGGYELARDRRGVVLAWDGVGEVTLRVNLIDANTGTPVSNARVTLLRAEWGGQPLRRLPAKPIATGLTDSAGHAALTYPTGVGGNRSDTFTTHDYSFRDLEVAIERTGYNRLNCGLESYTGPTITIKEYEPSCLAKVLGAQPRKCPHVIPCTIPLKRVETTNSSGS